MLEDLVKILAFPRKAFEDLDRRISSPMTRIIPGPPTGAVNTFDAQDGGGPQRLSFGR